MSNSTIPLTEEAVSAASRAKIKLPFGLGTRRLHVPRRQKAPPRRSRGNFSDRLSDYATGLRVRREKQKASLRAERRKLQAERFAAKHPTVEIPG
jgi:hypothetical protein